MKRRALVADPRVVKPLQPLAQLLGNTRLANAALSTQQHRLPFAAQGLFPAAVQQCHFRLAPDEAAAACYVGRLKAGGTNIARHLPDARRLGNALQLMVAAIDIAESTTRERASA